MKLIWLLKTLGYFQGLSIFIREAFGDHRKSKVNCRGKNITLRLNSRDIQVLKGIFVRKDYDIELAKTPKVIIDAGAHIGLASIFFAEKYPNAKIFAIEPEHSNFLLLTENTTSYAQIVPINKALWKLNSFVHIYDRRTGSWGFAIADSKRQCTDIMSDIKGVTLPWIMETYHVDHIDILKVDIEGSEKEVFEHSQNWIGRVGVIAIELHDRIKAGCSRAFYTATKDFQHEIRKGDIVFMIRDEYMNPKRLKT